MSMMSKRSTAVAEAPPDDQAVADGVADAGRADKVLEFGPAARSPDEGDGAGGHDTLDPALQSRRSNLERYFQPLLRTLDSQSREDWTRTTRSAGQSFRTRTATSLMVFAVGIALVVIAICLFYQMTS